MKENVSESFETDGGRSYSSNITKRSAKTGKFDEKTGRIEKSRKIVGGDGKWIWKILKASKTS